MRLWLIGFSLLSGHEALGRFHSGVARNSTRILNRRYTGSVKCVTTPKRNKAQRGKGGQAEMPHDTEESKRRHSGKSVGAKEGRYANFFQIGHNEFEFLIEFGQQDLGIHTRIYVSPQYARVLRDLLVETLYQHELEFSG